MSDAGGSPDRTPWSDAVNRPLMARFAKALCDAEPLPIAGKVTRVSGIIVEATLPAAAVGTACEIRRRVIACGGAA